MASHRLSASALDVYKVCKTSGGSARQTSYTVYRNNRRSGRCRECGGEVQSYSDRRDYCFDCS